MESDTLCRGIPTSGPYRATKLWNDVILAFRNGMPVGRRRRYMKTYIDCFSTSEAIDWLHAYLKSNPNFGPDVSRIQTVQLLQKLHRARVIEDVRGSKHNRADIQDNGRLFRFTLASPVKLNRTPFKDRKDLINQEQQLYDTQMVKVPSMPCLNIEKLPSCHIIARDLTKTDVEEVWKNITLDRLQYTLDIDEMDEILDSNFVNGKHIMHNCLFVSKNGIVTNIDQKDQLPHWALSAMKCLAHWPDKVDDNLPSYPGFEKDVFKVVRDYFCGLSEPLMTYEMYEVIVNVYARTQGIRYQTSQPNLQDNMSSPKSLSSFESVENLLMNLTNIGSTPECHPTLGRFTSSSCLDLSPIHPVADSFTNNGLRRCESSSNLPVARYETAFGPENRTVTRVYYRDGISTDYGYSNGPKALSRTPLETHFELSRSSNEHLFAALEDQSHGSYDVHFARVRSMREKKSKKLHKEDKKRRKSYGYSVAKSGHPDTNACLSENGDYFWRDCKSFSNNNEEKCPSSASVHYVSNDNCERDVPGYQPVLQGSTLSKLKHRAKSNASLHRVNSASSIYTKNNNLQYQDSIKTLHSEKSSSMSLHKVRSSSSLFSAGSCPQQSQFENQNLHKYESQESCNGRSLSMSDLVHREDEPEHFDNPDQRTKKSLQLVCLLLPPANRRKLHLLLKLMNKMADNKHLNLDDSMTVRALLLETFYRSILCSQDESDMEDILVMMIVSYLIDNYSDILSVPTDLKSMVDDRTSNVSKTQIVYSLDDPSSLNYCQQVSQSEYETNKLSHSQMALVELLDEIIADTTMTAKNKKKRLRQFQKTYPDIYAKRFPVDDVKVELFPQKPKIKQPLLVKPLRKLKGLRI